MILPGIAKLACGKSKGIDEFSGTIEAFAASLAPLIAFPLVGAVVTGLSGNWKLAILGFLSRLCAVLVLPVVVYEFSRLFKRQDKWVRTAIALNWCFWLVLPAILLAAIVGSISAQAGLSIQRVEVVVLAGVGLYLLWNRWFVLKSGLRIKGWAAALILLTSLVLMGVLSMLPILIGMPLAGV